MEEAIRNSLRGDAASHRREESTEESKSIFAEEADVVSSVKSLLQKERKLFEIELLKKDREISRLKQEKALSNNNGDPDHETHAFSSPPQLNALEIMNDPAYLARLTELDLSQVNVSEDALYELSKVLPHVPNIIALDLSENGLGSSHANGIVAVLTATQLKKLNLEDNYLGAQAALTICRAVVHGNTITDLNLSANPFQKEHDVGQSLGKALCTSARLQRLTITLRDPRRDRDSGTSRGQSASFVSKIGLIPSLEALSFVHAEIPAVTLKMLAQHAVRTLQELDLSNAFIGAKGAAVLSNELGKTSSGHNLIVLKQLNLSMNAIGNGGARSLSSALRSNKSLTCLGLNANNITCAGLTALKDALIRNRNLKRLSLERNDFEETKQALAFVQAVENPGCKIECIGRSEHIMMSEELKSRLGRVLSARARRRLNEKDNDPDMVRIFIQSFPKRFKAKNGQNDVEVLRLEIPNLSFPNPPELPTLLHVSWQPRYAWKIVKEKEGVRATTVKSGSKATTHTQLRGWEPNDVLVMFFTIPDLPEAPSAATIQVNELQVYAGTVRYEFMESRRAVDHVINQSPKVCIVHDTPTTPLAYVRVNEVELCTYSQNDVLVLRWSVLLNCDQGSKRYNRIIRQFGVDWKLEISGSGYSFKRGSSKETGRVVNDRLEYEVIIDYDEESTLSIGDSICLWMRPSSELPGHLTRLVGGVLPLTICCSYVQLSVRRPKKREEDTRVG